MKETLLSPVGISPFGGLAQLARASALHAEGQRFESVILHLEEHNDMMEAKGWPASGAKGGARTEAILKRERENQ